MTVETWNTKIWVKNVASVEHTNKLFLYGCEINDKEYMWKFDTAASEILLSLSATQELNLQIQESECTIFLGDQTSTKPQVLQEQQ